MFAERGERLLIIGRGRARPRRDRAFAQGEVGIGHDEVGIDLLLEPEPAAGRTGAERIVEREQPRFDFRDGEAGDRTGEFRGKDETLGFALRVLFVGIFGDGDPVGEFERGLEAFGEPGADIGAHHDPVDDDIDVVLQLLVERRRIGDLIERAVDLQPLEAAFHEIGDFLAIFALAAADHRRDEIKPRALRQSQHAVDHLAHRLAFDRQAGRRRIGDADTRPQEAHVIVDLGHRADGRARVFRRASSARSKSPATGRRSGRRRASA